MGLWLVKHWVSSNHPEALPAIAQSAVDSGDDLLVRLLFTNGLASELDDAMNELNSSLLADGIVEPVVEPNQPLMLRPSATMPLAAKPSVTMAKSSGADCGDVIAFNPDKLQINTTDELSLRMQLAKEGLLFDSSKTSQFLGGFSLGAGRLKGAEAEIADKSAGYADLALTAVSTLEKVKLALEPKRIASFTVTSANNIWVEDRPISDTETAWLSASVKAEGDLFNVSKLILESMINAYGMVPGPIGTVVSASTWADSVVGTKYVESAVDNLTKGACIRIEAPTYGPYSVSDADDKEWTKVRVEGGAIALDPANSHKFFGLKIGQSTIHISLNSDKFPLPFPNEEVFPIFVQQIVLSSSPPWVRVETPGEEFVISSQASNSYGDSLGNIEAAVNGAGSIVAEAFNVMEDRLEVTFKTPATFDELPTAVEFIWTGDTLPGGNSDGRKAMTTFDKKGKITLAPESACMTPGEELMIAATIEGFPTADSIAWIGDVSSVGGDNLSKIYTAPSAQGSYTITAFDSSDPSVFDEVHITVSQRCLKKAWSGGAGSTLDGSGVYSNHTGCAIDNYADTQGGDMALEPDPDYPLPPIIPSENYLWHSKALIIGDNFIHSSTRWDKDDQENCHSLHLIGENNTKITFSGEADGTLSYQADIDMTVNCRVNVSNDVVCSEAGAMLGGQGFYYLEINKRQTVRVFGELSCSMQSGRLIVPGGYGTVTASVMRYANGVLVPLGGVSNPDGSMHGPLIFQKQCASVNDTVTINEVFVLDAPQQSGATDTVVLHIMLPSILIAAGDMPAEIDDAMTPFMPTAGTYTAAGTLGFSVKVQ